MFGARSIVRAASCVLSCALTTLLSSAAPAQTIDLSLNVFYATPSNVNSGGVWELVAKSSNSGIAAVVARVDNIASNQERAPRGTVNGSDAAGFNIYEAHEFGSYLELSIAQAPLFGLMAGEEQGVFYGVGTLINGAPNYPGKPPGTNSIGPAFTSFSNPQDIPWATGDIFGNPVWNTAARMASGVFDTGVTPTFFPGSTGTVFTSIGTSTTVGNLAAATISTIVRTNFTPVGMPSADYNQNGIVDGADYVVWRNTLGQSVPNGTGADGSNNGMIDDADYTFWRSRFGLPMGAGSGGSLSTGAIPEPTSLFLLAVGMIMIVWVQRRFRPCVAPAAVRLRAVDMKTKS